jgi:hypothetical protein
MAINIMWNLASPRSDVAVAQAAQTYAKESVWALAERCDEAPKPLTNQEESRRSARKSLAAAQAPKPKGQTLRRLLVVAASSTQRSAWKTTREMKSLLDRIVKYDLANFSGSTADAQLRPMVRTNPAASLDTFSILTGFRNSSVELGERMIPARSGAATRAWSFLL